MGNYFVLLTSFQKLDFRIEQNQRVEEAFEQYITEVEEEGIRIL